MRAFVSRSAWQWVVGLLITGCQLLSASGQTTAFTYQGRLSDNGAPASGTYDLTFSIYDAVTNGNVVAGPVSVAGLPVSDGLFTVELDFGGSVFNGAGRWLEIGVRTNGSVNAHTLLNPRQAVTSTPYAMQALNAATAVTANTANSVAATNITGTIRLGQLSGGLVTNGASGLSLSGSFAGAFSGNGAGLTNLSPTSLNGVLNAAQIPNLDAAKVTSGVFSTGQIPNLDASKIVGGTLAESLLSANVVRLNGTNLFTGTNGFAGVLLATNANNQFTGTFTGNGGGLTNLPATGISGTLSASQIPSLDASKITSGTLAFAQLPATLVTNGASGVNLGGSFSGSAMGLTNLLLGSLVYSEVNPVKVWGSTYTPTNVPPGLTNIVQIARGVWFLSALRSDGTIMVWNDKTDYGLTNIPPQATNVVALASGTICCSIIALKADGSVVVWGYPDSGENNVPPGLVAKAVGAGWYHTLAVRVDGTVAAWGQNNQGQSTPPSGLSNVVQVAGGCYTSFALKDDGTVVVWGYESGGIFRPPNGLTNVVQIAAGSDHAMALKSDGTVVAWGVDYYGSVTVPAGLSNVVSIAAGEAVSVALKRDGTVVAWGRDVGVPAGFKATQIAAGGVSIMALTGSLLPPPIVLNNDQNVTLGGTFTGNGAALTNLNLSRGAVNNGDIYLRAGTDPYHGLGWYGTGKLFGGNFVDGPVLYGWSGGALGAMNNQRTNIALQWDSLMNVTVRGNLTVGGTIRGDGNGLTNFMAGTALPPQIVPGVTIQAEVNHFYLLTNDGLVSMTLPAALAVGHVIRICGAGAGGWTLLQNAGQSIQTASPFVLEKRNWMGNPIGATNFNPLYAGQLAASSDGLKLLLGQSLGSLYTSVDGGRSWAPMLQKNGSGLPDDADWRAVSVSGDGSTLLACSTASFVKSLFVSTDFGLSWRSIANGIYHGTASSADGSRFYAVSTDSNYSLRGYKDAPVNYWPIFFAAEAVACSADGSKVVAVGNGIRTSTDYGTNWTLQSAGGSWIAVVSSADGTRLATLDTGGKLYTSVDSGTNWTFCVNLGATSLAGSSDGLRLVMSTDSTIYTSTDGGATWKTDFTRSGNGSIAAVASSGDGKRLVASYNAQLAIGFNTSDVTPSVLLSSTATSAVTTTGTGGSLTGTSGTAIELVYVGNGRFMVASQQGEISAK